MRPGRIGPLAAIVGAILLGGLAVFAIMSQQPAFVSLTIDNPTDERLQVAVKGAPDDSVLPLATVDAGETRRIESVIDQGDRWIFVVGRRDVRVEMPRTRDELEDDDWTVVLEETIADEVRSAYPPLDAP